MDSGSGTHPEEEGREALMKQDRKVWHQCEGCGRREKLSRRQKHWCPCQEVRYQMIWVASQRLVTRIVPSRVVRDRIVSDDEIRYPS
jgi:hypothetical protein